MQLRVFTPTKPLCSAYYKKNSKTAVLNMMCINSMLALKFSHFIKAHQELDKAFDLAYRPQPFINETKRIEFLFDLYDKYTAGMFAGEGKKKKKA